MTDEKTNPPAAKPETIKPAPRMSLEKQIQIKVNIGLTREQAIQVIKAQEEEDKRAAKKQAGGGRL